MVIAGYFTQVRGVRRNGLAKLNAEGNVDLSWNPIIGGPSYRQVYALAVTPDGTTFVAGFFDTVNGLARMGLFKLNASGDLDTQWNPQASGGYVTTVELVGNELVAAGNFTSIGGQVRAGLAKLSVNGSGLADLQWAPQSSRPLQMRFDGNNFLSVHANGVRRISISGSGATDQSWQPAINGTVRALALDGTGNLFIGGSFNSVQGTPRANLAKLSLAAGAAIDLAWNPGADSVVVSLLPRANAIYCNR